MIKPRNQLVFDNTRPSGFRLEKIYNVTLEDAIAYSKTKEVNLNEANKVFFTPLVKTIRFKLKALCDKVGVSSTNKIETADYIFLNDVDKYNSCKNYSNKQIQFPRFYKMRLGNKEDGLSDYLGQPAGRYSEIYDDELSEQIKASKLDIIISEEDFDAWTVWFRGITGNYPWITYAFDKVNFISLSNPSNYYKLRHESHLISIINEDAIIITDQKYEELKRMFESGDNENMVLAMEIMANSNYEESILNNYLLLIENSYRLYHCKESSHKNFQSLLNFYDMNLRHMSRRITNSGVDEMAGFLKKYGKFTVEAMHKLLSYYQKTNHEYVGKYCNSLLVPNRDIEYDGHE